MHDYPKTYLYQPGAWCEKNEILGYNSMCMKIYVTLVDQQSVKWSRVQLQTPALCLWVTLLPMRDKPIHNCRQSTVWYTSNRLAYSVQGLGYGLDWHPVLWFPTEEITFTLPQNIQTMNGLHPASYSMGNRSSFPVCKVVQAWSGSLNST